MGTTDFYNLDPLFERNVALLCASSPKFFGSVGHALDADSLRSEPARLIVKTAAAIFKDTGRGPTHPNIVLQRLRRLNEEGKVKLAQINEVVDLMIETDQLGEPEVTAEIAPIIKRRLRADAVRIAMDEYSKGSDFEVVEQQITKARRIGIQDTSLGVRLGPASFVEIDRVRRMHRMPLGIPELDAVLRGGVPRGTLTLYIAGPGGGKSLGMSHTAAHNLLYGMFVGYATLELPETEVLARVKANLTGVPTDLISCGHFKLAKKRLAKLNAMLGTFVVHHFSPKSTSFSDIRTWVNQCENEEGRKMDLLVIDYIDKLKGRNPRDNEYVSQGEQTEEFRVWTEEEARWGLSGSQAKIKGRDLRKRIEIGDVRDSTRKVDVADQVITFTKTVEGDQVLYFLGKNRFGQADVEVGPLPHDWSRGRMVISDGP